jgi:hypothetical protein
MSDEPGFGPETHGTYEPTAEEVAARARRIAVAHADLATVREALSRLRASDAEKASELERLRDDLDRERANHETLWRYQRDRGVAAEAEVRQLREAQASLLAEQVRLTEGLREIPPIIANSHISAPGALRRIGEIVDALLAASPSDGGGA